MKDIISKALPLKSSSRKAKHKSSAVVLVSPRGNNVEQNKDSFCAKCNVNVSDYFVVFF